VPDLPGGGTVAYVNPSEHRYLDDPAQREEGGTPAIVEAIRAGLVFQLKQAVGVDVMVPAERSGLIRLHAIWPCRREARAGSWPLSPLPSWACSRGGPHVLRIVELMLKRSS